MRITLIIKMLCSQPMNSRMVRKHRATIQVNIVNTRIIIDSLWLYREIVKTNIIYEWIKEKFKTSWLVLLGYGTSVRYSRIEVLEGEGSPPTVSRELREPWGRESAVTSNDKRGGYLQTLEIYMFPLWKRSSPDVSRQSRLR